MKSLFIIFSLLVSSVSFAGRFTGEVKCWVPGKYKELETVVFKMVNGSIVKWDDKSVARPDAKSLFGLFSEPIDESAIEEVKFAKRRNGQALVSVITSAEKLTVGISQDLKTGFYKYEDNGSGNGNENFDLECEENL